MNWKRVKPFTCSNPWSGSNRRWSLRCGTAKLGHPLPFHWNYNLINLILHLCLKGYYTSFLSKSTHFLYGLDAWTVKRIRRPWYRAGWSRGTVCKSLGCCSSPLCSSSQQSTFHPSLTERAQWMLGYLKSTDIWIDHCHPDNQVIARPERRLREAVWESMGGEETGWYAWGGEDLHLRPLRS